MMELMQKANIMGPPALHTTGLGVDTGPLTGPAHLANENVFEKSFIPSEQETESPVSLESSVAVRGRESIRPEHGTSDRELKSEVSSPNNLRIPETVAENTISEEPEIGRAHV